MTAAERLADLDATDPSPSWDFYGIADDGAPGDRYAMDADLTLYWPAVRACWEER